MTLRGGVDRNQVAAQATDAYRGRASVAPILPSRPGSAEMRRELNRLKGRLSAMKPRPRLDHSLFMMACALGKNPDRYVRNHHRICEIDRILWHEEHTPRRVAALLIERRARCHDVSSLAEREPTRLRLDIGPIDEGLDHDLADLLRIAPTKTIGLYVDSPGGRNQVSHRMHAALRAHRGSVEAHVERICASAAVTVYLAASHRTCSALAQFLIHQTELHPEDVGGRWTTERHARMAKHTSRADYGIASLISSRTGTPIEAVVAEMRTEAKLDAIAATCFGIVTCPQMSAGTQVGLPYREIQRARQARQAEQRRRGNDGRP